ncbi:hypothetical protein [Streptomyces flaveolus]|uniref:hypothetical protein n=1 Tax=Streptomyces flaveolus TaxID=67297 RepID=UPI00332903B9
MAPAYARTPPSVATHPALVEDGDHAMLRHHDRRHRTASSAEVTSAAEPPVLR